MIETKPKKKITLKIKKKNTNINSTPKSILKKKVTIEIPDTAENTIPNSSEKDQDSNKEKKPI